MKSRIIDLDKAPSKHRPPLTITFFAVVSVFVSTCAVISNGYIAAGTEGGGWPVVHIASFGQNSLTFGIVLAILVFAVLYGFNRWFALRREETAGPSLRSDAGRVNLHLLLVCAGAILMLWLPCIIAMYPGIIWADTATQIYQFFGDVKIDLYSGAIASEDAPKISDHHPIFTTLVFSFFVWLGQNVVGSASFGFFIYVLFQAVVASAAFGLLLAYMRDVFHLGKRCIVAGVLFFGLFPIFPIIFSSVAKDTLFAPLFTVFSVLFCEIIRTRGTCLASYKFVIAFTVISVLMVLCKKLGFYVLALCIIALLIVVKKHRLVAVGNLVTCFIVLNLVVPFILYPALDAGPGSSKEMFSVPFQQTALYFRDHADDVTAEEYEVIDDVLVADSLALRYYPETADYIKNPAPGIDGNLTDYVAVYIAEGLKHPGTYLRAFMGLEAGFMSTSYVMECQFDSVKYDYFKYGGMPDIYDAPDALSGFADAIRNTYYAIAAVPGLNILLSQGLYAFIIPLIALVIAALNDRVRIAMMMPYFASVVLLFLSPISIGVQATRYILPLLCILPLFIGVLIYRDNEKNQSS